VLPDGCADIVWRSDQGAVVAGPDTAAWLSHTRPGELIVGARLLPGAGGAALGLPLSELRNQRVPLPELGLDRDGHLRSDADPGKALGLLAGITAALVSDRPPDRAVHAAVVRLLAPSQRIDRLAGKLGFSERQLRRRSGRRSDTGRRCGVCCGCGDSSPAPWPAVKDPVSSRHRTLKCRNRCPELRGSGASGRPPAPALPSRPESSIPGRIRARNRTCCDMFQR
jgi:Domain of unknown function (DUF6597)